MWLKFYVLFAQYVIFNNLYECVVTKAMIGPNVRILNDGEFNFIVSIKKINRRNPKPETDHQCTGSLISYQDVLTVAHLVTTVELSELEIIVGSVDIRAGAKFSPAWYKTYTQWTQMHNLVPQNEVKDIAIIRLRDRVPTQIKPVMINPLSTKDIYGLDLVIAGWGINEDRAMSNRLRAGVTKALTQEQCVEKMQGIMPNLPSHVPENIVCSAADPHLVTTPGNSGSPVLFMGSLVAIHKAVCPSMGFTYHPCQVNVHLTVGGFAEFILSILQTP